jgi:hypothetical protein
MNELLQDAHFAAKRGLPPPGCFRRIRERAVLVPGGEGIIQVIEQAATGDDELPTFAAIRKVIRPDEARLIVTDYFLEMIIHPTVFGGEA